MSSKRIERWLLGLRPVHSMVVNRLVLGGVLFCHAASRVPEFGVLYGRASAAWSEAYREVVVTFRMAYQSPLMLWIASLLEGLEPESRHAVLVLLYALLLVSSFAFTIGFHTRTAGAIAIALHALFHAIHPLAYYGWAAILVPFTLYVLFSRAGEFVSVDAWRKRRRRARPGPSNQVPAWPMRLVQVHVCAMYFHTGFARIDDPGWLRGEALFEALTRALYSRFTFDLEPLMSPFQLLSYATFLLEPLAAFLLWIPCVGTFCALVLIAMHGILEILTNVGWWNYIMIGGLLTFLPSPWVAKLLPRIDSPDRDEPRLR